MKRHQVTWLLILLVLLVGVPLMQHVEGKTDEESAIFLPFVSAPAGKWIAAYQWGANDRGGQTVGLLEMGHNQFKLIGKEFVIYLNGDGTADHAAYLTSGGDTLVPLADGKYVIGEEIWSDHCEIRTALLSGDESTLWNKMASLRNVDCGSGFNLAAGGDSIYLQHMFNNQSVSGYSSWLVRLDGKGDLAWSKLVGQGWNVGPFAMTTTANGGLILTAFKSGSTSKAIVAELDSGGQLIRAREIHPRSGSVDYVPWEVSRTADGGTVLGGSNSENEEWILKLDKNWEIAWQKRYTLPAEAHLYAAKGSKDGGVILQGLGDIVKIRADGSVAWARSYDHQTRGIYLNNVSEAGDGTILVAASLQGESTHYPLSMKLDPDGLVANCDLIRSETVKSADLDLVIAPTAVAMQEINADLLTLDPGYTGPIEAGSDVICSDRGSAACEKKK